MANATTFLLCCQGKDWLFPGSQKEGAWIWENPGEKRRKTICGVSLSPQLDGFERSTVMTSWRAPTVIGQRRWKCYKRCHSQSNKNTFTIVIKNALNFELVLRSFSLAIFFPHGPFEVYVKPIRGSYFPFLHWFIKTHAWEIFFKGKSETVDVGWECNGFNVLVLHI